LSIPVARADASSSRWRSLLARWREGPRTGADAWAWKPPASRIRTPFVSESYNPSGRHRKLRHLPAPDLAWTLGTECGEQTGMVMPHSHALSAPAARLLMAGTVLCAFDALAADEGRGVAGPGPQQAGRVPVTSGVDGFIRVLVAYQPKNPNTSQTTVVLAYALADLFIGVRDPNRRWDLALYGKNIADTRKVLGIGQINPPAGLRTVFGDTDCSTLSFTPRREFGVILRYAFGSD
jgi:hypothetical protein